jgi:collagenase-like PrtC family protease
MKVAVVNYSGNVGKTTVARHLLSPRMGDCPILFVETINEGGHAESNIKGRDFKEVLKEIPAHEKVVVDVGSSNIEQVFAQLKKMHDAHEDFDYFVIPTVPAGKQQADTAKIVEALYEMGVDSAKIKVLFNQVEDGDDVSKVFGVLLEALEPLEVKPSTDVVIHQNELFPMLGNRTVEEALCVGRDFKAEIAEAAGNAVRQREIAEARIVSRLAKGVKAELDAAFAKLFPRYERAAQQA